MMSVAQQSDFQRVDKGRQRDRRDQSQPSRRQGNRQSGDQIVTCVP